MGARGRRARCGRPRLGHRQRRGRPRPRRRGPGAEGDRAGAVPGRALARARANGERLGLEVEWLASDGFAAVAGRRFDVVAANPPYLFAGRPGGRAPELRFEPHEALVAGPTGLEAVERLAAEAPAHLEPGGALLVEVGEGQAEVAEAALRAAGLERVGHRADLAGIVRVVGGLRPG